MTHRGTSNTNSRGNAEDRRRRKVYLLEQFGDGTVCRCAHCSVELTMETVTVDRIIPGALGGRYVRDNIQPACGTCNSQHGATVVKALAKAARGAA